MARILRPLRRRIQLLINRAVVNAIDDAGGIQLLQVAPGSAEVLHNVERHQPYGLTTHPHKGAEAIVASLGGSRSHSLVILVGDRRYRLKGLEEGEVALYDDQGQQFILRRGGIEVNAPLGYTFNGDGVFNGAAQFVGAVQMDSTLAVADAVTVDSTLDASGKITSAEDVDAAGISLKTHIHPGVQTGGGTTGTPQ